MRSRRSIQSLGTLFVLFVVFGALLTGGVWQLSASTVSFETPATPIGMYFARDVMIGEPWYETAFPGLGSLIVGLWPSFSYPSCEIEAHPGRAPRGGTVFLKWQSAYGEHALLTDVGIVPLSAIQPIIDIYESRDYTLVVSGRAGVVHCTTHVEVI